MGMTLSQLRAYITGVLKGWLTNKVTIDKFSENDGELLWNGQSLRASPAQVIRVRENISAKHANAQIGNISGNTKNSDGGNWLSHPITDYDEIIVSIEESDNITYSEPVPVSRIIAARNQGFCSANVITVVSKVNPICSFAVGWSDTEGVSPDGLDFAFSYVVPKNCSVKYVAIEGIKYMAIPANEDVNLKNLIGRSLDVILDKTMIPVRAYNSSTLQSFAELECSIEEYDEIIIKITVDWKINNVIQVNHFVQHENIPIESATAYGYPCVSFMYTQPNSCSLGFIDATHLGVLWCNKETNNNGFYVQITGIKYETITESVTNSQVSNAVTETLERLEDEEE